MIRESTNHLNKECASHLAKKIITDLNVLVQFMESLDNTQFSNSSGHLHAAHQAMNNFLTSIQSPVPLFGNSPQSKIEI